MEATVAEFGRNKKYRSSASRRRAALQKARASAGVSEGDDTITNDNKIPVQAGIFCMRFGGLQYFVINESVLDIGRHDADAYRIAERVAFLSFYP